MSVYLMRSCGNNFGLNISEKKQAARIGLEVDVVMCSSLINSRDTLLFSNIKYKKYTISYLCREKLVEYEDYLPGELTLYKSKLLENDLYRETTEQFYSRLLYLKSEIKEILIEHSHIENFKLLIITHDDLLYALTKKRFEHGEVDYYKI